MKTANNYRLHLKYRIGDHYLFQTFSCNTREEAEEKWLENMIGQTKIFEKNMATGVLCGRSLEQGGVA